MLVLSDDDDFDDLAGAATLPNLGPLDDDPVAHSSVHCLILRRATSAWDGPSEPQFVIHQADQWLLVGHVGEHAQHGQAGEKALGAGPGLTPNEIRSASSWGAGRRS